MRVVSAVLAVFVLAGCVSSQVCKGAAIGATSGAVAGAGVGLLISDKDLLGSENTPAKGDTSLGMGETIAASAAIGVVFGAVVGAMIGHQNEPRYGREINEAAAREAQASPETAPDPVKPQEEARAPAVLRF